MSIEDISVTIVCLTYNHEKYIRQCLEGFILQKTNFNFEVIVHDDASTDKTASIIKEYENKYPDIIKGIYQTENKYSKRIDIFKPFILPITRGKYMALCEGDDYWISNYKLQRQYDALKNNENCHLAVCKVMGVNEEGHSNGNFFPNKERKTGIIKNIDFLWLISDAYSFQTSSYFFETNHFYDYQLNMLKFMTEAPVGDVGILLYFSSIGDVYYINETMSCYRQGAINSWSEKFNKMQLDQKVTVYNKMINVISKYDDFTQRRFHDICKYKIHNYEYKILLLTRNYKQLKENKYKQFWIKLSWKQRFFYHIMSFFPLKIQKIVNRIID